MRLALSFLSSWDKERETRYYSDEMLGDERPQSAEYFMGSRLGANVTYEF